MVNMSVTNECVYILDIIYNIYIFIYIVAQCIIFGNVIHICHDIFTPNKMINNVTKLIMDVYMNMVLLGLLILINIYKYIININLEICNNTILIHRSFENLMMFSHYNSSILVFLYLCLISGCIINYNTTNNLYEFNYKTSNIRILAIMFKGLTIIHALILYINSIFTILYYSVILNVYYPHLLYVCFIVIIVIVFSFTTLMNYVYKKEENVDPPAYNDI